MLVCHPKGSCLPLRCLLGIGKQVAQGLPNGDQSCGMRVTHTLSHLTGKLRFWL